MKKSKNAHSRPIRTIDIIGIAIVGLLLIVLWAACIAHLAHGNYFGHINYYGQPVGPFLLLPVLIVITPLYIYLTIKTIKERKIRLAEKPKWMNKPPWKFPWEGN